MKRHLIVERVAARITQESRSMGSLFGLGKGPGKPPEGQQTKPVKEGDSVYHHIDGKGNVIATVFADDPDLYPYSKAVRQEPAEEGVPATVHVKGYGNVHIDGSGREAYGEDHPPDVLEKAKAAWEAHPYNDDYVTGRMGD
jgi:hypothetical protein